MKMCACFTQLRSRTGGEAAVLEQYAEPHADGVAAEGMGCSLWEQNQAG